MYNAHQCLISEHLQSPSKENFISQLPLPALPWQLLTYSLPGFAFYGHFMWMESHNTVDSCVWLLLLLMFSRSIHIIAWISISFFFFYLSFFFAFSRAAPVAYGGSQARGLTEAVATGLRNARSEPHLQPTPQLGNAGSLTHLARPGIELATSRFLVGFVNHWATTGTPWQCDF